MVTRVDHVMDAMALFVYVCRGSGSNMVTYNTQYRKHYKSPHWDDFAVGEYCRKLDYRVGRRSVEHRHQPWSWDSEDDERSEVDQIEIASLSSNKENKKQQKPTQTSIDRHKKQGTPSEEKKTGEDAEEVPAAQRQSKAQTSKYAKPRKTRTKKNARKTKVKETPKSNVSKTQREPFVSYGWANKGPIEKKYTYNVKANPNEVYPAALRALKRRELGVRRKLENERQAAREQEIMKEKFFNLDHVVSSTFLTEYQRSYCLQDDVKAGCVW